MINIPVYLTQTEMFPIFHGTNQLAFVFKNEPFTTIFNLYNKTTYINCIFSF